MCRWQTASTFAKWRRASGGAASSSVSFDAADVTYYMAHEQIVPREEGPGLPRIVEAIFAFLQRNSAPLTDYFRVPRDKVVEIGREFAI
jgi:KUP system potassium uptake protein